MLANFSNLITFSRGSNATVTDASGWLTYAANNLLTNSQDFEVASWTKTAATITANSAVAPDGTTTADTIIEDTTAATAHRVYQAATNQAGSIIASAYVKAGTRSWFYIRLTDSGSVQRYAYFNVSAGTLGTVDAGVTASITPAGNGWYRCSALVNAVISTTCVFAITDANGNPVYNGNGTGSLYLWGAQLEAVTYQTTPSPYVSTSVANLLGFSEAFDNAAWTKSNSTIVPGAAQNPINNLWNAQKLMENTVTGGHNTNQSFTAVSGTSYTMSCYIKAGERTFAALGIYDSATKFRVFNLTTGSLGSSSGITGSSITAVGNGWYRCSITITAAVSGLCYPYVYILPTDNFAGYAGDGNSGIYIYGAQLSNSGSLDPYVPTPGAAPSSTAYYGPRFDYDPVTLAPKGLLIEEQRTNLLTYSEQFDNAVWSKVNSSVTANATTSPSGTATADLLIANTSNTQHRLDYITTSTAATHAFSVYAKAGGYNFIYLRLGSNGGYVNLSNGAVSGVTAGYTATATDVGNGWYRIVLVGSAALNDTARINVCQSATTDFAGDGTSGIYIYGAQLEAGAFSTSYIPTVASTVTRSVDVAAITGSLFSQWYNQGEGALVVGVSRPTIGAADAISAAMFTDGSNTNELFIKNADSRLYSAIGGVTQVNLIDTGKVSAGVPFAAAFSYKLNDYALATNGGAILTDTSATVPTAVSLGIGSRTGSLPLNGYIRSIQYIPNAISNTQLQSLSAS